MGAVTQEKMTAGLQAVKKETPRIIMEARVREVLGEGFKLSGDAIDTLNEKVANLIDEAGVRCKANGRVTLQPQDF
jgi:hypothetical protein